MKNLIWLIERTDEIGYDEYVSAVVCAPDEETAVALSYIGSYKNLAVKSVGEAFEGVPVGMVMDSFNAG